MKKIKHICDGCNHEFSSAQSLNSHKKNAKYCPLVENDKSRKIKKQVVEEDAGDIDEVFEPQDGTLEIEDTKIQPAKMFKCDFCVYTSNVKANTLRHQEKSCKLRPTKGEEISSEKIIANQLQTIKDLQTRLENATKQVEILTIECNNLKHKEEILLLQKDIIIESEKAKNEVHMFYANMSHTRKKTVTGTADEQPGEVKLPFTRKTIASRIDLFDKKMFSKGAWGLAEFIRKVSNDGKSYRCTDERRHTFRRIGEDGKISIDKNAKFIDDVLDVIRESAKTEETNDRFFEYHSELTDYDNFKGDSGDKLHQQDEAGLVINGLYYLLGDKTKDSTEFRKEVADILIQNQKSSNT